MCFFYSNKIQRFCLIFFFKNWSFEVLQWIHVILISFFFRVGWVAARGNEIQMRNIIGTVVYHINSDEFLTD